MKELKLIEMEKINAGIGPFLTAFVSGMGVGAIKMLVDGINSRISRGQNEERKVPHSDSQAYLVKLLRITVVKSVVLNFQ